MPYIVKSLILVIAYLVAAKIGLVFGTVSSSAMIFWPPGGIALAALLLGGVRFLPPVFVGAYLTAEIVHAPSIFAVGFSLGNMLESYIGFYLLQRFGHVDFSLSRLRDLALLVVLGALIPAVFNATLVPLAC